MKTKSMLREYFESLTLSVVIVLFVRAFLAEAVQVPTASMENTLLPGDHLFINKFTFRHYGGGDSGGLLPFTHVRRRDIVVFKYLDGPETASYYVKRVVGLPGETVSIDAKQVYINGKPLDEPYAVFKEPARKDLRPRDILEPLVVPDDHFFVLGDNRDRSYDSRFWGPISRERIVGRPLLVWWSFDREAVPAASGGLTRRLTDSFARFFRQTRWNRTGRVIH
jgi:signal peptidase I